MKPDAWRARYGPWAVVAGASEGLGAAFARELCEAGLDVVLVARREGALQELARSLRASTGRAVRTLCLDLAAPDAAASLLAGLDGLEVGTLVYNATYSPIGAFVDAPLEGALQALDVNVRTLTAVVHPLGRAMAGRGRGALVLLSSLTAFQGSPFVATYGATKSFTLALAEGLWFELKDRGVEVLAVCAGATRTPNFLRAAPDGAPGQLEPEQVAREAVDGLHRGPLLIPGRFNRLASFLMRRLLPRRTTIGIMGDQTRRLQGRLKGPAMLAPLLALALAADPASFARLEERDGILLESRPFPDSPYVELRLTTTTTRTAVSLCDAAFGTGRFDPQEPDLKSRVIVEETADERVTYDQISPPLVANRDYAVRARRERGTDGSCAMRFSLANELAPPKPEGWVRLTKVSGSWTFTPLPDGKTRAVYQIHSDPAGSIPPFLVEGSRRGLAVKWLQLILSRGQDAAAPDAGP